METATGQHGGKSQMNAYSTSLKTWPTEINRMQDVCRKAIYIQDKWIDGHLFC